MKFTNKNVLLIAAAFIAGMMLGACSSPTAPSTPQKISRTDSTGYIIPGPTIKKP